jgi:hypothetical protein
MRAELGRASPFSSVVAANGHGISDDFGSRVGRRDACHPVYGTSRGGFQAPIGTALQQDGAVYLRQTGTRRSGVSHCFECRANVNEGNQIVKVRTSDIDEHDRRSSSLCRFCLNCASSSLRAQGARRNRARLGVRMRALPKVAALYPDAQGAARAR